MARLAFIPTLLVPGEDVIHVARFHVLYVVQAASLPIIAGAIVIWAVLSDRPVLPGIGPIGTIAGYSVTEWLAMGLFMLAVFIATSMFIIRFTTEMAVTTRRVIFKRGWIARHVSEVGVYQVETIDVKQGILGRMLNYGRVFISGTGVGEVNFPLIQDPFKFRRAIEYARAQTQADQRRL